ncbi:MAG TPA: hypothetical protein VNF29_07435 [Candidatus Binataceae bacterium]|nr:hypothetical protein [Candidatus Binataceae bacterium]
MVLCAFFVLGVMTGFSAPGRALTLRVVNPFSKFSRQISRQVSARIGSAAAPAKPMLEWLGAVLRSIRFRLGLRPAPALELSDGRQGGAIAMVERPDGFYALFADGELRGPVSPNAEGDLPILSGTRAADSRGIELVAYAATMVRSEAVLSHLVSEMSIGDDGTAALYLDRTRTEVVIDLDDAATEIRRAGEVLAKWRGRERTIAALDMTTPGEAVVRLAAASSGPHSKRGVVRKVSVHSVIAGSVNAGTGRRSR